jgi:DNA-binding response OmpR family regulator
VVDDDPDILQIVGLTLESAGYQCTSARSAAEAFAKIEKDGLPHLALVDIMMPEVDGLEFCRKVHEFCDLPFIMLTAVSEEEITARAIREVAEDYVVKPFRPRELLARIERLLRRVGDFSYTLAPQITIDGRLVVDFAHNMVVVESVDQALTPTETKLLYILLRSAGRTITTDYLLRRVWPLEEVFEDTLRVHIHRLRRKLESNPGDPKYLVTKRGEGYSFAVTPAKN